MPLVGSRGGLGRGIASIMPDVPEGTGVRELERRVDALERELARHESRTEFMTAERMYVAGRRFIESNPAVWGLIKSHARAAAGEGRRFSMKREFENMRGELAPVGDARWRFRNSLAPVLVRFLLLEVPEVGPYVARGRSKVDKYFDGTCEPPGRRPGEGGDADGAAS